MPAEKNLGDLNSKILEASENKNSNLGNTNEGVNISMTNRSNGIYQ